MIEMLEQGVMLVVALTALGLYLWGAFMLATWLWRKLCKMIDARLYHSERPVTNHMVLTMWEAAKATPVMFFAPAILLWRWLKNTMNSYINAVDQLVAEHG